MDRFSYSRNGDNGLVDQSCQVRVQLPAVTVRDKHATYQIRITNVATRQSWDVWRRFSEFLHVRNALLVFFKDKEGSKCPGCVNYEKMLRLFEFPRKHVFTSDTPVVLNYRKVALRSFVAMLASHTFTAKPKCPTCSGFAFTAVQDFLTQDLTLVGGAAAAATAATSSDAIRESIDVRRLTEYHPVSALRSVDSDGKFTTPTPGPARKHHPPNRQLVSQPRPNAQKQPSAKRPAAKALHDDLLSPPHSSTGSSSGSFGSVSSPVADMRTPAAMPTAHRHPHASAAAVPSESAGDDSDGSFVSFTGGAARAARSSSRRSRSGSSASFVSRRSQSGDGAILIKKKSEKPRLHFTRRRSSAAAAAGGSADDDDDDDNVDGEAAVAAEDDEINMDFLQNVSIAQQ
ncbi:hypothetical protein PybrP1_009567 [[Pythium] brassicae (nom. inval.)]|nr:hypothetical protein PybrP1_009567 [[Pythium] brassicae (nom. inval.)]